MIAHPGGRRPQTIKVHTNSVIKNCINSIGNKESLPKFILNKDDFFCNAIITCMFHDFAKWTGYFQEYLLKTKQKNDFTHHGLLSAIITYHITKQLFKNNKMQYFYSWMNYLVVKNHHSKSLQNIKDYLIPNEFIDINNSGLTKLDILKKQIDSIENLNYQIKYNVGFDNINQMYNQLLKKYNIPLQVNFSKKQLYVWIEEFYNDLQNNNINILKNIQSIPQKNKQYYFYFNYLFSLLISSDRTQAAFRRQLKLKRYNISPNIVNQYKSKLTYKTTPFNILRENAYQEIENVFLPENEHLIKDNHIFSINLPTGMGKTFCLMNAAVKLRNYRMKKTLVEPTIIYAAPFRNVLDQTFNIMKSILDDSQNSELLLQHHCLSELDNDNNTSTPFLSAKLLADNFMSNVIITTFVQIYETIFTNRSKKLMKFNKYNNSIIILDEIQSLPIEYWGAISEVMEFMSKYMNVDFILVTATQPQLFKNVQPLVNSNKYFFNLDRINMQIDLTPIETTKFVSLVKKHHQQNPKQRRLIIVNTINCAKEIYNLICQDNFVNTDKVAILTTNLTPKERVDMIEKIKKNQYEIVVSTQLVESGVDIDFNVVYRDLAPIDSIIQSSGRCNRECDKIKGTVYVINLAQLGSKNKLKSYYSYIYSSHNMSLTKKILTQYLNITIKEIDLINMTNTYFQLAMGIQTKNTSNNLLSSINNMKLGSNLDVNGNELDGVNNFRLINKNYSTISVFIEQDFEAQDVWQEFMTINRSNKNQFAKKEELLRIRSNFYNYIIQVSIKNFENATIIPQKIYDDFYYVSMSDLNTFYSRSGFYIPQTVSL